MTDPIPSPTQATRMAIELLTPYISAASGEQREEASAYIGRRIAESDELDRIHILRGQLYLNELLLLSLAKASGAEDLRAWAEDWLITHSIQLPD